MQIFFPSTPQYDQKLAEQKVNTAIKKWILKDQKQATEAYDTLWREFPDGASPQTYWHDAYKTGFTDFFSWGHDHDFGYGIHRKGTMHTRHIEILTECLEYGYISDRLDNLKVLDVGCWTGGDVLILAGLGAVVTALEEHPVSARAAARLIELLNVPACIYNQSLFQENTDWQGFFDIIYMSGVIYHVTDPLLALRICFVYLKPGGRLIVESKACHLDGPYCEYSGTREKGWNWYAPTFETLGRWLLDIGFHEKGVALHVRPIGRLLALAVKDKAEPLPDKAGFSRPGSWIEKKL